MVCDRNLARSSRVRNLTQEMERFSFIETISESDKKSECDRLSQSENSSQKSAALSQRSSRKVESALALESNAALTIAPNWYANDTFPEMGNSSLSNVILLPVSEFDNQENRGKPWIRNLDKVFFAGATCYLGFVVWWLFFSQGALFTLPWVINRQVSLADAEFIEYMQQSLELIERQTGQASQAHNSENTSKTGTFIPIYTLSAAVSAPSQPEAKASLPNLLPPPPPNQWAKINPPISAAPIVSPPPPRQSESVATVPTLPSNAAVNTPEVTRRQVSSPEPTKPTTNKVVSHTLVGVVALNENSAALFKADGITYRTWLGEKVGNTDWILKSVSNQQVTIRNGPQTKTLVVGEIF